MKKLTDLDGGVDEGLMHLCFAEANCVEEHVRRVASDKTIYMDDFCLGLTIYATTELFVVLRRPTGILGLLRLIFF
jgi:hypothetical protein